MDIGTMIFIIIETVIVGIIFLGYMEYKSRKK